MPAIFAYILTLIMGTGQTSWLVPDAPYNNPSTYNYSLTGISCNSEGVLCSAVGFYHDLSHSTVSPLSYTTTNGGQTWSTVTLINVPMNFTDAQLNGVS